MKVRLTAFKVVVILLGSATAFAAGCPLDVAHSLKAEMGHMGFSPEEAAILEEISPGNLIAYGWRAVVECPIGCVLDPSYATHLANERERRADAEKAEHAAEKAPSLGCDCGRHTSEE